MCHGDDLDATMLCCAIVGFPDSHGITVGVVGPMCLITDRSSQSFEASSIRIGPISP